jgi:hypothetical protein
MKKLDQVFNLVRLKNLAKCGHSSAAVMYLMLDLRFTLALSHSAQIRSESTALPIHSVAMFTPLLVKEHRSGLLIPTRVSLNNRRRPLRQTAKDGNYKHRTTDSDQDLRGNSSASSQRKKFRSAIVHRE